MALMRKSKPVKQQAPPPAAAVPKPAPQPKKEVDPIEAVMVPIVPDPPEAPPQRGFIEEGRNALMRLQLQIADSLRKKVLAPDLGLDWPLDKTPEREQVIRKPLDQFIQSGRVKIPPIVTKEKFYQNIMDEAFGFGPIQPLIDLDGLTEIMVNGPYIIFIERSGHIIESGLKFLDDDHVERIIKRIVYPLGRLAGENEPLVDARLPDGSRVNAVLRPCALDGPNITIRKFSRDKLTIDNLLNFGSLTPDMALFLEAIVVARQNIVVSGGTGSGKTTLINCLSAYIPEHERNVTIEDAAELQLKQRNVVRLETKKPTPQSPNEVTIRDCVKNALRMRPERIVVGECRGGEALDMLQAMNTGHDGSLTTVHANNPRACINRLATLVLMAGVDFPISVVRRQIGESINFIVQASRLRDGSRKVTHITEVQGLEGEVVILTDIFKFNDEGDIDGKVAGAHKSSGIRPKCTNQLKQYGFDLPSSMFM